MGLYFAVNLVASVLTARKKGWHTAWKLPLAFMVIHLSYGAGFLWGLFKFWNRWGDKRGQVPTFYPLMIL
jgi:hypothetical protein